MANRMLCWYLLSTLRHREKHGNDPQCITELLKITSGSIIFLDYWHNNRAPANEIFRTLTISALSELMFCRPERPPTWHGIWYGLAGITWYMVWPTGHGMVHDMAWQAWHCLWYGLAGMARYLIWPGRAWRCICYYLGRHGMIYGITWRAWHGIRNGLTGKTYGLLDMAWYMIWPGRHGMVYGTAWWVMAWFMVWPGGQWHCICYGLAGKAWYMVWTDVHGIVHGMTWWASMVYVMA